MKFKFFNFILILFIFIFCLSQYCFADDLSTDTSEQLDIENLEKEVYAEVSSSVENTLNLNSRVCVVIDRASNSILFEKDAFSKRKMASTTKIMTALVVIENSNLKDVVEVSKKAANTGGSRLGLKSRR